MIGAGTIRARLLQGDTLRKIGAELGLSPDAMQRPGLGSRTVACGRHRDRSLARQLGA